MFGILPSTGDECVAQWSKRASMLTKLETVMQSEMVISILKRFIKWVKFLKVINAVV